jgi:hypothetical protein
VIECDRGARAARGERGERASLWQICTREAKWRTLGSLEGARCEGPALLRPLVRWVRWAGWVDGLDLRLFDQLVDIRTELQAYLDGVVLCRSAIMAVLANQVRDPIDGIDTSEAESLR